MPGIHYGRIIEATHHMGDRVNFPNMLQELVAKSFTLRGSRNETCDIDELDHVGHDPGRLDDFCQVFQSCIRDLHDADVRVYRTERVVLGRDRDCGQRLEQGGLPDVGQTYDSNGQL